ncbi:hypothetical protein [Piscibacillus halophilus]|nr:hypothetical protein [Piscibacillus halophilus]
MKSFLINHNFSRLWGANLGTIMSDRFRELVIPWLILNITKFPLKH